MGCLSTRVYVLSGGRGARRGFYSRRGLALGIEYEDKYLLFDTGPDSSLLYSNSTQAGFPLNLVDFVVISHSHTPHIGGLEAVGWESPFTKAFLPYGSLENLGKQVWRKQLTPVEVVRETEIVKGVFVSRPYHGPPWEHFLLVESGEGVGEYILFSGCFHPGVDVVLNDLEKKFRIRAVVGGFHLEQAPFNVVEKVAEALALRLGIREVYPLHCSGSLIGDILSKEYKVRVTYLNTGDTIEL